MNPKRHILCLLMVLSLLAVPSWAQEEAQDIADLSLEDLLDVQITSASKFAQKQSEAPGIVSVVNREQVDRFGWLSLNDILARQAGFFPSRDYDRSTIGSRGLFEGWNNNHLLMLMDGIPVNDNLYGTAYTWEITPLFLLKSLEIIRGPGSALYGSNATNGVLSIKTLSSADLKEEKGMARVRLGGYNTQVYDLMAGGEGKAFDYLLGFNHFRTSGNEYVSTDGSGRTLPSGALATFEVRDHRNSDYFFGKLEGKGKLKGLSLQMHHQAWDYQTGHGWLWMVPDVDETMKESRLILALSYMPESQSRFHQEYLVRYQRHNINWNMEFYPRNAFDGYYPSGVWENLKTTGRDVFARAQFSLDLPHNASLLWGLEGDLFFYNGDDEHYSNTDLTDAGGFAMTDGTWVPSFEGWWAPYPNGENRTMGPWLEWVLDKPVKNLGIYSQFASGEMLGSALQITLGARYDTQWFDFLALDKEGKPTENKSFSQFSPRIGLVYVASPTLSFKALAGRAFRAPAPTEMFGANTFTLASNLRELDPEIITTFEGAVDWRPGKGVGLRLNVFHNRFENQIAYSLANNNLSTNVYTLTNLGVEGELTLAMGPFMGFANLSVVKRLDEEIVDETISAHPDDMTWAPAVNTNLGISYAEDPWVASVQLHFQGKVKRRGSDFSDPTYLPYRPEEVKSWTSLDARVGYRVTRELEVSLNATNLLDEDLMLVKNFAFPFDYRMMGRRVFVQGQLKF